MENSILGVPARTALGALAIAASASFLLCGYEFIRSVSQSLFIKTFGADALPLGLAGGAVMTLVLVYLYGHFLSAAGPRWSIAMSTAVSAIVIFACYLTIEHGVIRRPGLLFFGGIPLQYIELERGSRLGTAFLFTFREAYIVILVEQAWAFINSIVRIEDGRRLNGPICGLASIGSIGGATLVHRYAQQIGSSAFLMWTAAALIPAGLFALLAYSWGGEPKPAQHERGGREGHMGGRVLFRNKVLRDLALVIFASQVVAAVFDVQLGRYVQQALTDRDAISSFYGGFYAWLNVAAAFAQFVLTPVLLWFLTLRHIHIGIPMVQLVTCAVCIIWPSLYSAAAALLVFKAFDYSIFRAAKELLYVPLSFDARYRAKELIDAFGYRFSKGMASSLLGIAGKVIVLPAVSLPIMGGVALASWVPLALAMTKGLPTHPRQMDATASR